MRLASTRARALSAAAVLLLVSLVVACGGDDEGSDSDNSGNGDAAEIFPPNIVRDSDIEAQEDGSPQRALLEWWQAFQFADAAAVTAATSPETLDEIGESNLAALVEKRGQGLQGIEVLSVTENGNTASVRVGLLTFQPTREGDPPPTTPTASKPATISMTKRGTSGSSTRRRSSSPWWPTWSRPSSSRRQGRRRRNRPNSLSPNVHEAPRAGTR